VSSRRARKILVVDDEPSVTGSLEMILSSNGFEVLTANSFAAATAILNRTSVDLVITDLRLSDASGIDVIKHIKRNTPETEVILMTGYGSLDITIEAIKAGAYYYLEKPYTPDRLFTLVDRALQLAELRHENESLKRTLAGESETFGMIGRDPGMRQIFETIRTAAPSDASVLIEGESGTGKELIATAFHTQSQRAAGPFIRINCAAIPHELIESELFGYKRGAFTGAVNDSHGEILGFHQVGEGMKLPQTVGVVHHGVGDVLFPRLDLLTPVNGAAHVSEFLHIKGFSSLILNHTHPRTEFFLRRRGKFFGNCWEKLPTSENP